MVRILIADDHEVVRYALRNVIELQRGWEVVAEASNGKDAISMAVETKPDVAILDYAMPLINGVEATRNIRARLPNTEVLIFTVHDDDALIQKCLIAGARGYLLKSDMESALLSAIEFLAVHKPFFTGKVSETLLDAFLATTNPGLPEGMPKHNLAVLGVAEGSVLQLAAEGHTNEQIARRFNLSLKFVEELVRYAIHNNLIDR